MRIRASVVAVVSAFMLFSAPAMAQQKSTDSGVVLSTLAGVVIGGAVVYYYYPLSQLTTTALGAVVGGAIGNWWYNASSDGGGYDAAQPRKQSDTNPTDRPFHLIAYSGPGRPMIRAAH